MSSSDEETGKPAATNQGGERVDAPNPNDVLCGRGGNINSHKGNEQFRKLVEKRKRVYLTARFKREKRLIASSIVNEIRGMEPPGRFLARKGGMKDGDGYWFDIGDEKARDKTSQALRENAPSIRAEIETEINQQRAEMRRQETPTPAVSKTTPDKPPAAPFPPHPALAHSHPGHHGPPPQHSYNPSHQSHYTQQYYDYYYHYYGYGAPPPPPPPGYATNSAPPPPPAGYPPPHPYWAATSHSPNNTNGSPAPPAHASSHPVASAPAATSVVTPSPSRPNETPIMTNPTEVKSAGDFVPRITQEEEDRRLAMALQQEENAKAFDDRNRRFGSDRRSSRSTAYCAPGYRPRLLNDSVEAASEGYGSTPTRKKRPPMSASHFFGPSHHNNHRERKNTMSEQGINNTGSAVSKNSDANTEMEHEDHFEMDLKLPAMNLKRRENQTSNNSDMHQDFSCSSLSSRGRMHFKDDSDMISLIGEGETIIPLSNANSTGSFHRIRNTFGNGSATPSNNGSDHNSQFNPIALNHNDQNHRQHPEQQLQQHNRPERGNSASERGKQQSQQDSSLLSQVAQHILGNFGAGPSWNENKHNSNDNSLTKQQEHGHDDGKTGPDAEMEMGQEVIMDVRDESSSMPPPQNRGPGTVIDWPSRAGCHTWIPDSMLDNTNSSSRNFGHDDNYREDHDNRRGDNHRGHQNHHHTNDHSLTRDISPINSMDMDFSKSSYMGVRHRANGTHGSTNGEDSLMNIFDKKNVDPNPEELLPQIHRSALQQIPSWERSYRSRSSVSLGDMSGVDESDGSLIRVQSRDIKDKIFGVIRTNSNGGEPGQSLVQHNHNRHHPNHHFPTNNHLPPQSQTSMKSSDIHGHHVQHHQSNHHGQPQAYHESREMNMDWD